MEARLFGGVDLITMPTVLVGRTVEVLIRDMAGKTVPVVCFIKEVGNWDPKRNSIAVKGILSFLDGRKKKFIGIVVVSVTTTIEMIP